MNYVNFRGRNDEVSNFSVQELAAQLLLSWQVHRCPRVPGEPSLPIEPVCSLIDPPSFGSARRMSRRQRGFAGRSGS
jgi:hypothetical protein